MTPDSVTERILSQAQVPHALEPLLAPLPDSAARRALTRAAHGEDLSRKDIIALFQAEGATLEALLVTAHTLRLAQALPFGTYVVNRNINFTNICYNHCRFCAYSRPASSPDAFFFGLDDIMRRAEEATTLGATEVCIQAGVAPQLSAPFYVKICRLIHGRFPNLHIHAFSPQEIVSAARKSRRAIPEYLRRLQEAGLGSVPGTSAEILDDNIRAALSPRRITAREWLDVITNAHAIGLKTTATMMYGHIEGHSHRADHLLLLRNLQRRTGGFTEFVPLRFVAHPSRPLGRPLGESDVLKMHAVARLALGKDIPNIQVSWVKEGPGLATRCLRAGANDLGGTLVDEAISASAGATNGQFLTPRQLRALIREAGLVPAQRSTLYEIRRIFPDPASDPVDPFDSV